MAFLIADSMARYLHKQDEARRKVVTFSTDIQGLVPQFLDKIMVSHSSLQWGEAGEVISRDLDNLVVYDKLDTPLTDKTIVFRNIDGSVSDPFPVSATSYPSDLKYPSAFTYPGEANDSYNITVYGMPSWVGQGTFYTIQDTGTAKEFLVISVKPSGESVQIDCVNYDEDIYT